MQVKTAFLFDALNLFITAYANLDIEQEMDIKSLTCDTNEISTHGYRLSAFISMVNQAIQLKLNLFSNLFQLNMTKGMLGEPISGLLNFNSLGQRISLKLDILELRKDEFKVMGIWDSNSPDVIHYTITEADREKEMYQQLKGRTFRVVSRYNTYSRPRVEWPL